MQARITRWWRDAALLLLNTVAFLVAINLLCAAFLGIRARLRHEELGYDVRELGIDTVAKAYPDLSRDDLKAFLRENDRTKMGWWAYDSSTQFKFPEMHSRFVNVAAAGFRTNGKSQRWPPDPQAFNVFVFGGSTSFGVGVPDSQTYSSYLPAQLQALHPGRKFEVYNFAVTAHMSSQERARFEKLLLAGAKPDLAIFFDGFNECAFNGDPAMTPSLEWAVHEFNKPSAISRALFFAKSLAAGRVASAIVHRHDDFVTKSLDCGPVIQRYVTNKAMTEAIAARFGVATLFVWQPTPFYNHDLRYDIFAKYTEGMKPYAACFAKMATMRPQLGDDFLWLADMQLGRKENLYVDAAHYTAAFHHEIARALAAAVRVP